MFSSFSKTLPALTQVRQSVPKPQKHLPCCASPRHRLHHWTPPQAPFRRCYREPAAANENADPLAVSTPRVPVENDLVLPAKIGVRACAPPALTLPHTLERVEESPARPRAFRRPCAKSRFQHRFESGERLLRP